MSSLIGLILGTILGWISYLTLKKIAARVEMPETKRLLGIVGIAELVLLPVIGYAIGAYVDGLTA